jgi:hypothetical protein
MAASPHAPPLALVILSSPTRAFASDAVSWTRPAALSCASACALNSSPMASAQCERLARAGLHVQLVHPRVVRMGASLDRACFRHAVAKRRHRHRRQAHALGQLRRRQCLLAIVAGQHNQQSHCACERPIFSRAWRSNCCECRRPTSFTTKPKRTLIAFITELIINMLMKCSLPHTRCVRSALRERDLAVHAPPDLAVRIPSGPLQQQEALIPQGFFFGRPDSSGWRARFARNGANAYSMHLSTDLFYRIAPSNQR